MLSQNDWNFNNIGTKFELDEVIPKFETEVRADANGEIIKNRDGSERRFNTDKIIDTYSHLYPSKQKTLANKLDDLF